MDNAHSWGFFFCCMKFTKLPKTYEEQLALLKERGLSVTSDEEAIRWLRRVSYYRLSAYFIPFQYERPSEKFLPGATWDRVIDLYIFDCRLRHLFRSAMERMEVAFRTTITYELAHEFGTFGHACPTTYSHRFHQPRKPDKPGCPTRFEEWIASIRKEEERANEIFVKAYRAKYEEPELPIWMATELMSFGTLSIMFSGLNNTSKQRIADYYKIASYPLESWMHALAAIRNITAHNSRLWNRTLRVQATIPHGFPYGIPIRNRVYCIAVLIQYCLLKIARGSQWKGRLFKLFDAHSLVPLEPMGFPQNWRSLPPWK
jgi:abortive infection bacteriophage resistance protein